MHIPWKCVCAIIKTCLSKFKYSNKDYTSYTKYHIQLRILSYEYLVHLIINDMNDIFLLQDRIMLFS